MMRYSLTLWYSLRACTVSMTQSENGCGQLIPRILSKLECCSLGQHLQSFDETHNAWLRLCPGNCTSECMYCLSQRCFGKRRDLERTQVSIRLDVSSKCTLCSACKVCTSIALQRITVRCDGLDDCSHVRCLQCIECSHLRFTAGQACMFLIDAKLMHQRGIQHAHVAQATSSTSLRSAVLRCC